jgi:hypothetical protein
MRNLANGDLIKLGTLYMGSSKIARPTKPWGNYSELYPGADDGNIQTYSTGATLEIRDTDPNDDYKMQWIEVNDGGKKYLVCDRVMIANISWNDLNAQNLIFGKNITIDGRQYRLRVLTGGSDERGGDRYAGGAPTNNEWDRWIVNEAGLSGLPNPSSTDLDSTLNSTDLNSPHNQKWNWMGVCSWCQETYAEDASYRAKRGYYSARYWGYSYVAYPYYDYVGWRPVLEIPNSAPQISGSDENLGNKNEPFNRTYQVSDPDGDNVTVTEKINGQVLRSLSNAPQNQNLTLTITQEKWDTLAINTEHTITIEASDGKGGVTVRTLKFTKTNAPPVISGTDTNLGDKNMPFSYTYQVSDPDGDPVTVVERLNGTALQTRTNVAQNTDLTITIDKETLYSLAVDTMHTISIEASDDKGNTAYRNVTFRRVNAAAVIETTTPADLGEITAPPTIVYKVSDPEGDSITVTEYLNGQLLRTIEDTEHNAEMAVTIPWDTWVKLKLQQHTIKVRATDSLGTFSEKTFTFARVEDRIQVSIKNPIETPVALAKVVPVVNAAIPAGYKAVVTVANNAFDEEPTWEDATQEAMAMQAHEFQNNSKTADKWGFSMKIIIAPEVG